MLSSDAVLERAAELKASGVPFVLATVVRCDSPTSAKPGAKGLVDADGQISGWIGGGCAQPAVVSAAMKALADGQARLIRVGPAKAGSVEDGILDFRMSCHSGGTLDIFLEPFAMRPSLLIVGTSPVAQVLGVLAEQTGFDVFAASPGADAAMFPRARQVLDGMDLAGLTCGTPDFVVVATQGVRDEPGLRAALGSGARYIAFIASERKATSLRDYLKERGHDPRQVDAIVSPAGVQIGAVTPEEIALSVLADVVRARRRGESSAGVTVRDLASPGHFASTGSEARNPSAANAAGTASAIDPICGMSVAIATAEYRSEYQGMAYFFCCAGCQNRFEKEPAHYLGRAGATA